MGFLIEHSTSVTVLWIRKCGCTLLKNIFYNMNTGSLYDDQLAIHADGKALRQIKYIPRKFGEIDKSKSFVVMRDPTARFLSFYWDKIYSVSPYASDRTRNILARRASFVTPGFQGFQRASDLSIDGHMTNLHRLLDGLEVSLSTDQHRRNDMHYMPQTLAIDSNDASDCFKLRLEDFSKSVPSKLASASPGFAAAFEKIPRAHVSPKPYKSRDIFEPEMQSRLNEIYREDYAVYGQIDALPLAA